MKAALVDSNRRRIEQIESGAQKIVGVNAFTEAEPSPLEAGEKNIHVVDLSAEAAQIARLKAWRAERDSAAAEKALATLEADARADQNIMPASLAAAKAGVTTGEWAATLRKVYGEYRGPTGVALVIDTGGEDIDAVKRDVAALSAKLGRQLTMLIGKPGLDGHSNGAEQIAARARAVGMDAIYEGIRLTPAEIVNAALEEGVHLIGLSILSGSHVALVDDVMVRLKKAGLVEVPVVVGGIIPPEDEKRLLAAGAARVYTPKDYDLNTIMDQIVDLVEARRPEAA
jgi:(2R)-ethylmalonyl-CoA mutase